MKTTTHLRRNSVNSYRSHALRGNASCIAPAMRDAERHQRHSHAERGNDEKIKQKTLI